jgi:hypothetical protein
MNSPCIIEDFNDQYGDNPDQTTLGAVYGIYTTGSFYLGNGGYWYSYVDGGGAVVKNEAGEVITSTNTASMVTNKQLHVALSTSSSVGDASKNKYAGVGFNIFKENDTANFSKMTGITMRVKGSGDSARFRIETNDIKPDGWGYYGYTFKPAAQWQTLVIPVANIKPEPYSNAATKSWTFSHGATGVTKMAFQVKDGSDCDLYVDSIVANGMTYADFGMITGVIIPKATRTPGMFSVNATAVSFQLPCARDLTVSLRDITGKRIRTLFAGTASSKSINLNSLNVPGGQYLVMLSGNGLKAVRPVMILK